MTTPTPADAIRAAIGALPPNTTGEQIAATVLRVAADEILPRPTTGDQSRQAGRYRLLRQQFLTAADELAGNPAPAASQEALAEAREESQATAPLTAETIEADRRRAEIVTGEVQELVEWLSLTGKRAGQWSDEDANRYDRAVALLRQQEADLTTTREALRRRAEPIAWCRSDDFADADTKRQSFSGWREQHSDCDMALYGVPVPAFTMPATAPEDLARQLNDYATHLRRMEGIGAIAAGGVAEMLAAVIFLLQQHDIDLTTAREALRRLVDWGGFQAWHDAATGFDAETVTAVLDWFANGMTGSLPPLPPQIASREATIEPTPSVSDLPPALVRDGGDGVRISAANLERTGWMVWREIIPDREFLCTDGQWRMWDSDEAFLARTRWPSASAAWEALQRSRAAEGVEAQPAAPPS